MSGVPERYQRYTQSAQPTVRAGEVELHDDRDPVVYVPDAYGQMVPMRRSQLPAAPARTEPRDLAPRPLLDPLAQRFVCGGVGIGAAGAGLGWGAGQVFAGMALMGTSGLLLLLGLLLAAGARGRGGVHVHQEVHNHARWFGRNTTNL